jgi:tight adherence protein B
MNPMLLPLLIGLLVAGALAALLLAFAGGKDDGRAAERLDALVGKPGRPKDSSADMLLKQALQEVDKKTLLDKLTPEVFNLTKVIEQADKNVKPSALFGIGVLAGVLGAVVSGAMVNIFVAPVVGLALFAAPFMWIIMAKNARLSKFQTQLPDAMELVARALRAGHSLAAGMHVVAEEMPAPISKEFNRVYEEQNLGIPLEETLRGMCERVPSLDLRFFVTSVAIQRQTGGDLAEILDRIGHVIRERFKILGQVKALTAEGRLSGIVLVSLPIFLLFVMLWMDPVYVSLLWTDDLGIKMSVATVILMMIGSYAIKKIIDIKV